MRPSELLKTKEEGFYKQFRNIYSIGLNHGKSCFYAINVKI